jgi:hypothetical protein
MASISIKITGETENDPITEINCGRTSPKLGGNINISMFPELTGFTCEYNDIQNISNLALNPNLQRVEIDGNKLTAINSGSGLSSNLQLQYFDCSDNQLTGNIFDLSLNNNLTYFNCSGNKFTGFTSGNQIPYTLSTFNANNNNLYQTSVDSILDAFIKNNRDSSYGSFDLNLNGTNRHPSWNTSVDQAFLFSSGSNFSRSGTLVTANIIGGNPIGNGYVVTITGITNATDLNGTYIVKNSTYEKFEYDTTGVGFATGSGMAGIRWTFDKNDGFRKYQILTLPTGQTILDSINGDIQGRGLNVQINTFFDAIQIGNTISGFDAPFLSYDGPTFDINYEGNRIIAAANEDYQVRVTGYIEFLNEFYDYTYIQAVATAKTYELVNSNWTQIGQSFYADPKTTSDSVVYVSMSNDGNRIAVGYITNYQFAGQENLENKIYEWNGSNWVQIGQTIKNLFINPRYGINLNSLGNRLAISEKLDSISNIGTLRIFEYNGSQWVQIGSSINTETDSYGGFDVSMNSAGDIVVLGTNNPTDLKSIFSVYGWNGIEWSKISQDIIGDYFLGYLSSVSINSTGDIIALGSYHTKVYKYNGSEFIQLGQEIIPNISSVPTSVSLNDTGDRLAIKNTYGEIHIYEYNGYFWEKLVQKILPYQSNSSSVSLNGPGDIVGTVNRGETSAIIQVYQLPSYPI